MKGNKKRKSNADIAKEWDQIAEFRSLQLRRSEDLSMDHIIIPSMIKMMKGTNTSNVIDLGCGTGYATEYFKKEIAGKVIAIDISSRSIDEAIKFSESNVEYRTISIEDFSLQNDSSFSLGIANMTLMDVSDLDTVLTSISTILQKDSYLLITITHPFFWPFYWNYASQEWFDYSSEIEIEGDFNISLQKSGLKSTHYHRSLETYTEQLMKNGFVIESVIEPKPNKDLALHYPKKWEFPRFLGIKCKTQN